MKVLYFAWLRERIATASDELAPDGLATVADLVDTLRERGPRYQAAFQDLNAIRVAVDRKMTDFEAPLAGAAEVAFFPPMTGG